MSRISSHFFQTSPQPMASPPWRASPWIRRGGSDIQLQLDAAFSSFSTQATDPFSIASMTLAGLAGKLAKVGILSAFAGRPIGSPLLSLFSHIGSIGAEAGTLVGTTRWVAQNHGPSTETPLQEFASHFINFATFRLFGSLGAGGNAFSTHLIQSAAMMAGHNIAVFAGLETQANTSLSQQFFEANLATLQISVGGRLAAEITGNRLQRIEGNLEHEAHLASYVSLFPPTFSPFAPIPTLHAEAGNSFIPERLQEAYQSASDFDPATLQRIDNCLRYAREINAARSSGGTFKDGLLQRVVEGIAAIEDANTRNQAFQKLFVEMEMGLSQSALIKLTLEYNPAAFDTLEPAPCSEAFSTEHSSHIPQDGLSSWAGFTPQEKNLLLSFTEHLAENDVPRARKLISAYGQGLSSGRYSPDTIHRTLSHAMESPIGEYILRRLTCILATEDIPGKLEELREKHSIDIDELIPTADLITKMSLRGISPENIARAIQGSIHTAYLDDLRVAERVVWFYRRIYNTGNLSDKRTGVRGKWKQTLLKTIMPRWKINPTFTRDDLFDMMNVAPNARANELVTAYKSGLFEIEILDDESFDARMRDQHIAQGKQIAFFMQRPRPQKPLILIRGFKIQNLDDPENLAQLSANLIHTIPALFHEWEHARHFNGDNPFPASPNRADRMASEALAYLEEYAWRIEYLDDNILISTALLGMSPVTYFRSLADFTYYTETNERLARVVMP